MIRFELLKSGQVAPGDIAIIVTEHEGLTSVRLSDDNVPARIRAFGRLAPGEPVFVLKTGNAFGDAVVICRHGVGFVYQPWLRKP